MLPSWSFAECV